jgi:predicted RNA-binding protein with RPS1 domain
MSTEHVASPSDVVKEGQQVHVWVQEIDEKGRINLSMLPPGTVRNIPAQQAPRRDNDRRPPHDRRR